MRRRDGVEIARVGTFALSTGEHTFTTAQLASAVANHATGAAPRLAIGHSDPRFRVASGDGEPAIGRVENLRLDDSGEVLYGDYVDMPDWLADAIESAYPGRSIEASVHGDDLRISAVALLGVTRPGIHTLADLRSFVEDGPALVTAGADNDGHHFTVLLTAAAEPNPTPVRADEEEAPIMDVDTTLLRRRLGLPEDATEDQIREALAAPVEAETETPEAAVEEAAEEAEVVELPTAETVEETEPVALAAATAEITRLSSEIAELRAAEAVRAERETAERRDTLIASAIQEGRIAPGDRDHYRRVLDADEETGTALIQARAKGTVPLAAQSSAEPIEAAAEDGMDLSLCNPHQIATLRERGLIKETV